MTKIQFSKGLSSLLFCFFIIGIISNAYIPKLNDPSNNNKELQEIFPKATDLPDSPILQSIESPDENGYINLSWSLINGADLYNVYRFNETITEINGSLTIINSTSEISCKDQLLSNGTYYYAITAVNASGESQPSNCEWIVINFPTSDYKYATGVEGKEWVVGELPTGFTTTRINTVYENLINFQIISDFAGHERVLQIYDNSTTYNYKVLKSFTSQSKGFFSGFIGTSEEKNVTVEIKNSNYDHGPVFYMYEGRVDVRVMGVNINSGATYNNNELNHFAIEFDLETQTHNFYWNGVYYGNYGFYEPVSYLNQVCINTWSDKSDYYLYLDALICPGSDAANPFVNLYLQDLIPPGPHLHALDPINDDGRINLSWDEVPDSDIYYVYRHNGNITDLNSSLTLIVTTTENFTQDYVHLDGVFYYAVCSFNESGISHLSNCEKVIVNHTTYDYKYALGVEGEDWIVGELPSGFTTFRSDSSYGGLTNFQIISKFAGHEKVLQIYDNSATYNYKVVKSFSSQSKGFFSGFIGSSSEEKNITIEVKNSNYDHGPVIYMYNGRVYARVFGINIYTGAIYNINELYHFAIEFDCETQSYDFFWNGVFFGNYGFYEAVSYLNQVCINTWGYQADYFIYIDAIIFSSEGADGPFVNLFPYEFLPDGPNLHEINSPDHDGKIILTWDALVGFSNYNVYRYTSQITELNNSITFIGKTDISRICDFLYSNGTYYYAITATNNYLESKLSNNVLVEIEILPDPLLSPILYHIESPDNDGTYIIKWSSVENAENYLLFRHTSIIYDIDELIPIFNDQYLEYNETNLTEGIYYYCVFAINGSNWSEMSNSEMVIIKFLPDNLSNDNNIIGFPKETFFLSLGIISVILVQKSKKKLDIFRRRI